MYCILEKTIMLLHPGLEVLIRSIVDVYFLRFREQREVQSNHRDFWYF
jgi:hypothetical protein